MATGLAPLTVEDVAGAAPFRMYRAAASNAYMLEDERDSRFSVEL